MPVSGRFGATRAGAGRVVRRLHLVPARPGTTSLASFLRTRTANRSLRTTSGCAAEAVGQILSIDSESSDRRVMVALVDCGGFVLPSPIDVADPALIGLRVEFTVSELEVWRA